MRCVLGEARFFSDMGFTVWELGPCAARRVELVAGDDGRSRFQPFQWQMDEVVAEEQARVRRHEEIPGEENIPEGTWSPRLLFLQTLTIVGVQEEYVNKVASPVGKAMTPSKSGMLVPYNDSNYTDSPQAPSTSPPAA